MGRLATRAHEKMLRAKGIFISKYADGKEKKRRNERERGGGKLS